MNFFHVGLCWIAFYRERERDREKKTWLSLHAKDNCNDKEVEEEES